MRDRRLRLDRLRRLQQRRNAAILLRPRQPNRGKKSVWLFDLPDTAFKLNCRFNKPSVHRIASLLDGHLRRVNRRGNPVPPKDMVAVCLNQLCGVQFQRTNGLASGGLSQNASRVKTFRVVDALVAIHKEWIKFPTVNEMMVTSYSGLSTVVICVLRKHLEPYQLAREQMILYQEKDFHTPFPEGTKKNNNF